jgi:prepilin-type processing-associated H-X9-DG protein
MSYTSGYSTVWSTNTDYAINEGAFAYSANPAHEKRFLRGNLNRLRKTSQLVLFTDARPRKAPDPALFGFQDPWITWSPKVAATCSLGDVMLENGKAVDRTMFDPYRHKNRVNVAFADAHVEALNITAMDLSKAYLLPPP